MSTTTTSLLDLVPAIPIAVVHDADLAVPLAQALVRGGLHVFEIPLRTPAALEAIRRISAEVPEAVIGAGTVLNAEHAQQSAAAGATFLLSPGSTSELRKAFRDTGLPVLPGVSTPSEVMDLLEDGFTDMKLFPAEAVGGVAWLKSVYGPLPQARFCPTGGVTAANARSYLALPNVGCVGATWLVPDALLRARDWSKITARAAEAASWASPEPTTDPLERRTDAAEKEHL